jgi:hypothetical protein
MQTENFLTRTDGASGQEQRAFPISANSEPTVMRLLHGQQSGLQRHEGYSHPQFLAIQPQQGVLRRSAAIDAFINTCERWKLAENEKLILLGYGDDSAFLGNQILQGHMLATPQDARDRAGYLLAVSIGLGAIFNEQPDAERSWLTLPKSELNEKTPLDFMLEGRMENILAVLRLVEQERGLS